MGVNAKFSVFMVQAIILVPTVWSAGDTCAVQQFTIWSFYNLVVVVLCVALKHYYCKQMLRDNFFLYMKFSMHELLFKQYFSTKNLKLEVSAV